MAGFLLAQNRRAFGVVVSGATAAFPPHRGNDSSGPIYWLVNLIALATTNANTRDLNG